MNQMPNSLTADTPFSPVDLVACSEGAFPNNPAWPATDHPTLQKLRSGSPDERQSALRDLFLFYQPSIRSYIHHKWPQLQPPDVEDLASEFVIFCLTGGKPQLLTYRLGDTGPQRPQGAATSTVSHLGEKLRHLARVLSHEAPD